MNNFPEIRTENNQQLVDARILHAFCNGAQAYEDSINELVSNPVLEYSIDFIKKQDGSVDDYWLTLDTASFFALCAKTQNSAKARAHYQKHYHLSLLGLAANTYLN